MSDDIDFGALIRALRPSRRARRRVSLNSMAPARERSSLSVWNGQKSFRAKVEGRPAAFWIRVLTRKGRFVAMFKVQQAEVAARLSTAALVTELAKRGLAESTLVLADAMEERGMPEGEPLQHFSGRLAAMRRGTSPQHKDRDERSGTREGGSVAQVTIPGDEVTGATGDGTEG